MANKQAKLVEGIEQRQEGVRSELTDADLASLPLEYREWFAAVHINDIRALIHLYQSSPLEDGSDNHPININLVTQRFSTLLTHAIRVDADDCVKQLLDWGADVNAGEALDEAVMPNRTQFVKILLEHGVTITPAVMYQFAHNGNNYMLALLHEYGGDVNPQNTQLSPLMGAVLGRHPETVIMLLDMGADMNLTDAAGRTVVDYAKLQRNDKIYNILRTYTGSKIKSANKK